jgi:hypothetical protein
LLLLLLLFLSLNQSTRGNKLQIRSEIDNGREIRFPCLCKIIHPVGTTSVDLDYGFITTCLFFSNPL